MGEAAMAYETKTTTAAAATRATLRPTSRGKIVGFDPKLQNLLLTLDRVARTACTVLVTGESGTGKELIVAALHDASDRRDAPLVTVNCGAIPMELVESELFGHTRGAFTGAHAARRGVVAAAEGGTLFLDEVGELPLPAQVKLLRLLQQREYTPIGESRPLRCDVRIVAATHRDLEAEVRAGRFREDLFYRLNVIRVHVPALRDRAKDVGLLARHFFRSAIERSGRADLTGFSADALAAMSSAPWRGNVRALENAVERAVLLANGPLIEPEDICLATLPVQPAPMPVIAMPVIAQPLNMPTTPAPAPLPTLTATLRPGAGRVTIPPATTRSAVAVTIAAAVAAAAPVAPTVTVSPASPKVPNDSYTRRTSNPLFPRTLPDTGVDLATALSNYQSNLIKQALSRTGGNKNKAAQLLSMNRTTLVEIIRRRKIADG